MGRIVIPFVLWLLSSAAWAGAGADILFKDLRGVVPEEVVETLYRDFYASFLTTSEDGRQLLDEGGRPAQFQAMVEDLNKDGIDEIFVLGGNTFLSGHAGSSVWLFIHDADGRYRQQLGFPAASYEILPETSNGFPDLRFGGPGFCQAVWHWSGVDYEYLRKDGQCDQ
jgi:hypothetical protein